MNTDSERGEGPRFIPESRSFAEELNCNPTVADMVTAIQISITARTKDIALNIANMQYRRYHRDQPCCEAKRNCGEYCNFVCKLYDWLHQWAWRYRQNYLYQFIISLVNCFNWGKEEQTEFDEELESLGIYPTLTYAAAL